MRAVVDQREDPVVDGAEHRDRVRLAGPLDPAGALARDVFEPAHFDPALIRHGRARPCPHRAHQNGWSLRTSPASNACRGIIANLGGSETDYPCGRRLGAIRYDRRCHVFAGRRVPRQARPDNRRKLGSRRCGHYLAVMSNAPASAAAAAARAPLPAPRDPKLRQMANALRALAMDAVEKAKSGHPGMPMGMADIATVLFTQIPATSTRRRRTGPTATASCCRTGTARCCSTGCCI